MEKDGERTQGKEPETERERERWTQVQPANGTGRTVTDVRTDEGGIEL